MTTQPRVLVIGATGVQGGSVARHLFASGKYRVRCLARSVGSSRAMALRAHGAEIVEGDLENTGSLLAALRECDAVFAVTTFEGSMESEYQRGRNLVDAMAQS